MSRTRTRAHHPRDFGLPHQPGEPLRARSYILAGHQTRNQRVAIAWSHEVENRIRAGKRAGFVDMGAILAEVNRLYFPGEEEAP